MNHSVLMSLGQPDQPSVERKGSQRMNCPVCHVVYSKGAPFCLNCATALATTCLQCGTALVTFISSLRFACKVRIS